MRDNTPPKGDESEFKPGLVYRLAYQVDGLDRLLSCPSCNCELWIFHDRTGTKKLDIERMKLKCHSCGQWFIARRKDYTKVLGR